MRKINLALILVVGAAFLPGCKLNQMIKLAQENDLQIDPNPLEVHGGEVSYEMSAVLPAKILPAKTSFTLNQIYVYGDQEQVVGSTEFKADDFPNSSTTATRKSVKYDFPYQDGMNPGTLYIQGVATDTRNGKSKTGERLAVAQGLVLTSLWAQDVAFSSYEGPGYTDKEELIPTNVDFFFDQGRSKLRTSLSYDGVSNRSKRDDLSAFIAEKNVTRTVTITGSHSPEGTETINTDLAEDRAKTIESYYRARMARYDYKGAADSIDFIIKPVVQDWAAFRGALAAYDGVEDASKKQMLRIINGTGTFEDKEKELQKVEGYKMVFKNVYPGLRSAKTEVLTVKPKKSNAQISVLAKQIVAGEVSEDTLSQGELMFAATLTPSLEEKAAIYKQAASQYGVWQAHNNLAATHIDMVLAGDKSKLDGASTQLEIAGKKNTAASSIMANAAAVKILEGNYEEAYKVLEKISGSSNDVASKVSAMKGALEVRMGSYDKAKTSFNSAAKSDAAMIDKGLAHLFTGGIAGAKGAFASVSSDSDLKAVAYYLSAVASAKEGNASDVESSLKEAIKIDPSLKDKAINDLAFAKQADAVNNAVK